MQLEVFYSVIVGQFFSRLDRAESEDINATISDPGLAIRLAGMVDETSDICRNVSVDHARITCPEEVLPAILLHLLRSGRASDVFDDERALGYALLGE
jgi:hypothetical protein